MFFSQKTKKNKQLYTCDIGLLTTHITSKTNINVYQDLLAKANDININILGVGTIGQINALAFKNLNKEYKNGSNYPCINKIYPTLLCLVENVIKSGVVVTKFIFNTTDDKILQSIDKYLNKLYLKAHAAADKYLFNHDSLHEFLTFLNHKHHLQMEIWAFYEGTNLTCQLEPDDILKIPASFLGHCFHKYLRRKITLGSNCEHWNFYPSNNVSDDKQSIYNDKFYYLSPTNDLFV